MNTLVEHTIKSFERACVHESNIAKEALRLKGMTGLATRHFYNNLCSLEGARYLEIGTWKGSSVCSAISNNKTRTVCIDDFSEFNKSSSNNLIPYRTVNEVKKQLTANINHFKGDNDITFIESNCWDVDPSEFVTKFNIYMYDGCHDEVSHFRALNHFEECLDDEFIYIVDDWNRSKIQRGTFKSIAKNGMEILFKKEITYDGIQIRQQDEDPHDQVNVTEMIHDGWWNGIGIFVLKKNGA